MLHRIQTHSGIAVDIVGGCSLEVVNKARIIAPFSHRSYRLHAIYAGDVRI